MSFLDYDINVSQLSLTRDRIKGTVEDELASVCMGEISADDLCEVFTNLDKDCDGRIGVHEFAMGCREIVMTRETRKQQAIRQRLASSRSERDFMNDEEYVNSPEAYARGLHEGLRALSCQDDVCQLYQNLYHVDKPELVDQFENMLLNIINDVHQYQIENERLEKSYRREKLEHKKHLRRLEEEIEQQVQSVEERVRKQEKERLEIEKAEVWNQMNSEIVILQQNLHKLQQNGEIKMKKDGDLIALKKKLEEILTENRILKSELTDAQTNLALMKSQMSNVKHQLDEKSYELELDNKTVTDYIREIDKLKTQLHMMHETNKNLLDTNDSLRGLLDSASEVNSGWRRPSFADTALSTKRGSILSLGYPRKDSKDNGDTYQSDFPEFNQPLRTEILMISKFLSENSQDDNFPDDLDSGHSTLRDGVDCNDDTELDCSSINSDTKSGKRQCKRLCHNTWMHDVNLDSYSELDTDFEREESPETEACQKELNQSPFVGRWRFAHQLPAIVRDKFSLNQPIKPRQGSMKYQLPSSPTVDVVSPLKVSKDPERVYKLVLAGDAAVGKSSFIIRLCKGSFSTNLSTTLGVDFQTKLVDVDGQTMALQLWDTAGQERFRSVARTYFRRADGVLLLYDVTYERSFLNLRDWVNIIEDGSLKKIPIMLVGNKTDARAETEKLGRRVVKREDGLRFSQENEALFIETSAKSGSNILEAVTQLTRLLRTNEDLEVKKVELQLQQTIDKKSKSCCGHL